MRRSWLRRNRLITALPQFPNRGAGGLFAFRYRKQENLHFFGETPERRPWATKREDRPAAFAGRSKLLSRVVRDTTGVYTTEYPIPLLHVTMYSEAGQFDNLAGNYRQNVEGKQCDPLHLTNTILQFFKDIPFHCRIPL